MAFLNKTTGEAVNEYLAQTVGMVITSGTLASSTVSEDSNGNKILQKGVVLAKITSGADAGKIGEFNTDAGVTDGRQTAANIVGISDDRVDVTEGDKEVAVLIGGYVVEANVYADGTQGSLAAAVKTELNSDRINVTFR